MRFTQTSFQGDISTSLDGTLSYHIPENLYCSSSSKYMYVFHSTRSYILANLSHILSYSFVVSQYPSSIRYHLMVAGVNVVGCNSSPTRILYIISIAY